MLCSKACNKRNNPTRCWKIPPLAIPPVQVRGHLSENSHSDGVDTRDSAGQPSVRTGQKHRNTCGEKDGEETITSMRNSTEREREGEECTCRASIRLFMLAASRDRGGGAGRTGSRPALQQRNTGRQDCTSAQASQNQAEQDDDDGSQVES